MWKAFQFISQQIKGLEEGGLESSSPLTDDKCGQDFKQCRGIPSLTQWDGLGRELRTAIKKADS